jgi:hypothetical protein
MAAIIEKKTAAHVMMLWKYKPLHQDDALDPRWVQSSKGGIIYCGGWEDMAGNRNLKKLNLKMVT